MTPEEAVDLRLQALEKHVAELQTLLLSAIETSANLARVVKRLQERVSFAGNDDGARILS